MIKYVPRHIRVILLLLGTLILTLEAGYHYQDLWRPSSASTRLPVATTPSPRPVVTPVAGLPERPNSISRITGFKLLRTVDKTGIDSAQLSFTEQTHPTTMTSVQVYLLSYNIPSTGDDWQAVTATVYVPINEANPQAQYPLYVFGSGTTGMADKCAPSLENLSVDNLGNYDNHMIAQAADGYVSVFPDYEGFHSAKTQAYFIVESEAKVLLGAIAGLNQLQPGKPELASIDFNEVFVGGYSQGGHAALSAAQQWSQLPDTIKLRGIVQYAGAADVLALFKESPWLASYLTDSYSQYYAPKLDKTQILQEKWLTELDANNRNLCVNQAYKYYPHDQAQIYTTTFLDALNSSTWPDNLKGWEEAMIINTPLDNIPMVPILSIQGATDPIVTAATQRRNNEKLCAQGKNVVYRELPGVNHFRVRQESLSFSTQWMNEVRTGQTPISTCNPQ